MSLKNILFITLSQIALLCISLSSLAADPQTWNLVWVEDFDTPQINDSVWSKIPRGSDDWNRYMSSGDSLYAVSDGILTLCGICDNDVQNDTVPFLTGGLWTKGKVQFEPGRIEIKARFENAQGAWPAIWLLPADTINHAWPYGGEIDMMEHLNYDTIVYQTVHSYYTLHQCGGDNPPHFATHPVLSSTGTSMASTFCPTRWCFTSTE